MSVGTVGAVSKVASPENHGTVATHPEDRNGMFARSKMATRIYFRPQTCALSSVDGRAVVSRAKTSDGEKIVHSKTTDLI